MDLKAKPGCCEEASPASREFYIPCNQKATTIVTFYPERREGPYRMCAACTEHNVKRRGAHYLPKIAI